MALPTMATGFTRATFTEWCQGIDDGPFSSISAGERITFHNPELLVTNTAAAALTERVRIIMNLTVLPLHSMAMLAKQLATVDVLSGGRLEVGVGVGGREQDYRAVGAPFGGRHDRLDQGVTELRRLWSGGPAYEGGQPVGPAPVQKGGPPILAGALGPKSMARAARWADGVTGFSIGAIGQEMAATCAGSHSPTWPSSGSGQPGPWPSWSNSARPDASSRPWPMPKRQGATSSSWCRAPWIPTASSWPSTPSGDSGRRARPIQVDGRNQPPPTAGGTPSSPSTDHGSGRMPAPRPGAAIRH